MAHIVNLPHRQAVLQNNHLKTKVKKIKKNQKNLTWKQKVKKRRIN